ncbi:ATP-binding protein [Rhodoligotrophos defluvii]|uniref:ATP-binding protein n=1 Tax=Rhodoligotrophos defluvii TaxID=2561934 RepID=UPI001485BB64|nr:DUF87 domain-containing protein [Rhodoligotrophos defluvii]
MQDSDQESRFDFSSAAIGRIVALTGSHAVVLLQAESGSPVQAGRPPQIGSFVKFAGTSAAVVLGVVTAMNVPVPGSGDEMRLIEVELLGELPRAASRAAGRFRRGVSVYPTLGDQALPAEPADLGQIFGTGGKDALCIGHVGQVPDVAVWVGINDLFGNHLGIVGDRRVGKSRLLAALLGRLAEARPHARIVLFDQTGEHAEALADLAEVITPKDFNLPYWLLTVEELAALVSNGGSRTVDAAVLIPLIAQAKQRYLAQQHLDPASDLVDTGQPLAPENAAIPADAPVPYRLADLIELLDGPPRRSGPDLAYASRMRLREDLQRISRNPRYATLFSRTPGDDAMGSLLGQLFRISHDGKAITVVSLQALPTEAAGVLVAALSRLALDIGVLAGGKLPLVIACDNIEVHAAVEERHDPSPAGKALARIAREGPAHGVSLAWTSARPAELDPAISSQCGTVFSMRLTRQHDLQAIRDIASAALPSLLDSLPTLAPEEGAVFGDGLTLPCRVRLDDLPAAIPREQAGALAASGAAMDTDQEHLAEAVRYGLLPPLSELTRETSSRSISQPHEATAPGSPPAQEPIDWRSLRARIVATAGSKTPDPSE